MTEKEKKDATYEPDGFYLAPRKSCVNCPRAEWAEMYGVWEYCCNMSYCIAADEDV